MKVFRVFHLGFLWLEFFWMYPGYLNSNYPDMYDNINRMLQYHWSFFCFVLSCDTTVFIFWYSGKVLDSSISPLPKYSFTFSMKNIGLKCNCGWQEIYELKNIIFIHSSAFFLSAALGLKYEISFHSQLVDQGIFGKYSATSQEFLVG